jgi:hypothetical protein
LRDLVAIAAAVEVFGPGHVVFAEVGIEGALVGVERDAEDFEALILVLFAGVDDIRNFVAARFGPGGPEEDDDDFSAQVGDVDAAAINRVVGKGERLGRLGRGGGEGGREQQDKADKRLGHGWTIVRFRAVSTGNEQDGSLPGAAEDGDVVLGPEDLPFAGLDVAGEVGGADLGGVGRGAGVTPAALVGDEVADDVVDLLGRDAGENEFVAEALGEVEIFFAEVAGDEVGAVGEVDAVASGAVDGSVGRDGIENGAEGGVEGFVAALVELVKSIGDGVEREEVDRGGGDEEGAPLPAGNFAAREDSDEAEVAGEEGELEIIGVEIEEEFVVGQEEIKGKGGEKDERARGEKSEHERQADERGDVEPAHGAEQILDRLRGVLRDGADEFGGGLDVPLEVVIVEDVELAGAVHGGDEHAHDGDHPDGAADERKFGVARAPGQAVVGEEEREAERDVDQAGLLGAVDGDGEADPEADGVVAAVEVIGPEHRGENSGLGVKGRGGHLQQERAGEGQEREVEGRRRFAEDVARDEVERKDDAVDDGDLQREEHTHGWQDGVEKRDGNEHQHAMLAEEIRPAVGRDAKAVPVDDVDQRVAENGGVGGADEEVTVEIDHEGRDDDHHHRRDRRQEDEVEPVCAPACGGRSAPLQRFHKATASKRKVAWLARKQECGLDANEKLHALTGAATLMLLSGFFKLIS